MAVVLWTIPLMLLFVAIAVVPILVAANLDEKAARRAEATPEPAPVRALWAPSAATNGATDALAA